MFMRKDIKPGVTAMTMSNVCWHADGGRADRWLEHGSDGAAEPDNSNNSLGE